MAAPTVAPSLTRKVSSTRSRPSALLIVLVIAITAVMLIPVGYVVWVVVQVG